MSTRCVFVRPAGTGIQVPVMVWVHSAVGVPAAQRGTSYSAKSPSAAMPQSLREVWTCEEDERVKLDDARDGAAAASNSW